MRRLALYPEPQRAAVEQVAGLSLDSGCTRCELHQGVKTRCISAEGEPGGLLVVGEGPGKNEDAVGRPFIGVSGKLLRDNISKHWSGPVAIDNVIRCAPGARPWGEDEIEACRPYLAGTFAEVRPTRIVALGATSAYGLLGRSIAPFTTRRGYAWITTKDGSRVPIFFVLHPSMALRNRFVRGWFEQDMAWALTATPPEPPWEGMARIIETVDDSHAAVAELLLSMWATYDVETAGRPGNNYFEILSFSAVGAGSEDPYVWSREALQDPAIRAPLVAFMANPEIEKNAHNAKFDHTAVWEAWGVEPQNLGLCTRLARKLIQADASGYLDDCAELVGMGGHKLEAQAALEIAEKSVQKARQRAKKAGGCLPGTEDPAIEDAVKRPHLSTKVYAFALMEPSKLHRYNALDTLATDKLVTLERREMRGTPSDRTWRTIVRRASEAYAQIERWGIWVDQSSLRLFCDWVEVRLADAEARCRAHVGDPNFNPHSAQQVGKFVYGKLGIKAKVFTGGKRGTNPSTNEEALEAIVDKHPAIALILEARGYKKLDGNYASGLWEHIRDDGRVHPNFNLDGARSGRTSCVAEGTLVEVARDVSKAAKGIPIEEVRAGDWAYCYDEVGRLALRQVKRAWKTGHREVVRLHWRGSGHKHEGHVDLTPEHKVRLSTGGWVSAEDLQPGDRLSALSRGVICGYARLWPTGAEEITREHRFIFEQVTGGSAEHVHHDDENKLNNLPSNLEGMTRREHLSHHGTNPSDGLRQKRSERMRDYMATGKIPRVGPGESNPAWLGLTKEHVEELLREHNWSVTKASRAGGYDFNTFKGYVVRHGFDLARLKADNRALRNNHEVLRIERLGLFVDVYDLTIEGAHNFIAGEICVHNCDDPNLQNIPKVDPKKPETRLPRNVFGAPPGFKLVSLDYKTLELRIAAQLSGDPLMLAVFASGVDYHLRTAQLVSKIMWGIEPDQVGKGERDQAKVFNFGLLYGMTDGGLARRIGCSKAEAAKLRAAILGKFKGLAKWLSLRLAESRKTGDAWTWWDGEIARRRPLWQIGDAEEDRRINAENSSGNTPIQGTASDYCVVSAIQIVDWIRDECIPAKVVGTVHDSVMLEVRDDAVREVALMGRRIMEAQPCRTEQGIEIPLETDCEVGQCWGQLEKYVFEAAA